MRFSFGRCIVIAVGSLVFTGCGGAAGEPDTRAARDGPTTEATNEGGGAAMTDAERALWAASFLGRETTDGFLLLEGSGPLRLARAGEHAGPQLSFGSVEPARSLTLYPGECRPHRDQTRLVHEKLVEWDRGFADWCLSDSMRVHASGSDRFIGALIRDLGVRNVALANG